MHLRGGTGSAPRRSSAPQLAGGPLDHRVAVVPRRLVAVDVRLRVADRSQQRDPRTQLDVAALVQLLAGEPRHLAAAARAERFEQPAIVLELARAVTGGAP